ncbi:MAG TPA: hypothetical protein H9730_14115 [Candidatus Mediterraneibacter stercoripullorum]|nr:hypothetical protein [Candidatus Mediterraneibacter stercoripullorum]
MKKKYVIGFFAALFLVVFLLSAGYQISYRHVIDRQASLEEEQSAVTRSISAEGEAVTEEMDRDGGYLLRELNGFVAVYLADGNTIYELTEIPLSDLPEELQQQILEGKILSTEDELYGFLENYSS